MDEKGFLLGMFNRAKVIVRRGRRPPRETENGSREWITAVETCCANNAMLPPMVIYRGKGLYRSWFGQTTIMQTKLHQIDQSNLARILHIPFQPPTLPTVTASKAKTEKSDGRRAWSLQGSTNTPSKFLPWKAPQNSRQLRH